MTIPADRSPGENELPREAMRAAITTLQSALHGAQEPEEAPTAFVLSPKQREAFEQASDALADAEHYRHRGDFKAARLHAVQYLCHIAMVEKLAILQGDQP